MADVHSRRLPAGAGTGMYPMNQAHRARLRGCAGHACGFKQMTCDGPFLRLRLTATGFDAIPVPLDDDRM